MPLPYKTGGQELFKTRVKRHLQGQNTRLFGANEACTFGKARHIFEKACSLAMIHSDVTNPEGTIHIQPLICRSFSGLKEVLLCNNCLN